MAAALSPNHVYDLAGEIGLGGLAARYVIERAGRQTVVLNDWSRLDQYRVSNIDGLFDSLPVREVRQPREGDHGSDRGKQYADEKVVAFTGTIRANSARHLSQMRTALENIAGPAVEPGEEMDDATIRIIPSDLAGADRRGGGLGIDYFYNFLVNPNGEYDTLDWTSGGSGSPTLTSISDASVASLMGVEGPHTLRLASTLSNGQSAFASAQAATPIPLRVGTPLYASSSMWFESGAATGITAHLEIVFVDVFGNVVSTSSGATVGTTSTIGATSGRSTALASVPPGARAAYVRHVVANASAGATHASQVRVGGCCLVASSAAYHSIQPDTPGATRFDYGEASMTHGLRGHNMATAFIPDPDDVDNTGWVASANATIDAFVAPTRDQRYVLDPLWDEDLASGLDDLSRADACKISVSDNANAAIQTRPVPVEPGVQYTFSISAMGYSPDGPRDCNVRIAWANKTSNLGVDSVGSTITEGTDGFVDYSVTATAPAKALWAYFYFQIAAASSGSSEHVVSVPMINVGPPVEYGDASTPGWEFVGKDGYSASQMKPAISYVIERVDIDFKSTESQTTNRYWRDFLLTARCRDPRVYEDRVRSVVVEPIESTKIVVESPPSAYSYTIVSQFGSAGGIVLNSSVGSDWMDNDGLSSIPVALVPSQVLIMPDDSILEDERYVQIKGMVGSFQDYAGPHSNLDILGAVTKLIDDDNYLLAKVDGTSAFTISKVVGGTETDLETVQVAAGSGTVTGFTSYIRAWLVDDGSSTSTLRAIFSYQPLDNVDVDDNSGGFFYSLEHTLTGSDRTLFNVAAQSGFLMQMYSSGGGHPTVHSPPFITEYRESPLVIDQIDDVAPVGGSFETSFSVRIDGPASNPAVYALNSKMSIITNLGLAAGQSVTINSDGTMEGNGGVGNLLIGTALRPLTPFGSETFRVEGTDMDRDLGTKITFSWRRARR